MTGHTHGSRTAKNQVGGCTVMHAGRPGALAGHASRRPPKAPAAQRGGYLCPFAADATTHTVPRLFEHTWVSRGAGGRVRCIWRRGPWVLGHAHRAPGANPWPAASQAAGTPWKYRPGQRLRKHPQPLVLLLVPGTQKRSTAASPGNLAVALIPMLGGMGGRPDWFLQGKPARADG